MSLSSLACRASQPSRGQVHEEAVWGAEPAWAFGQLGLGHLAAAARETSSKERSAELR